MELYQANAQHFYAWVYQEAIIVIQAHHVTITTLPYSPEPKSMEQMHNPPSPAMTDDTQKLTNKEIRQMQKFVGSILYYA